MNSTHPFRTLAALLVAAAAPGGCIEDTSADPETLSAYREWKQEDGAWDNVPAVRRTDASVTPRRDAGRPRGASQ